MAASPVKGWLARSGAYLLIVALGVAGLWQLHNEQLKNCRAIEQLKAIPYADLTQQIKRSREFLRANPKGFDGFPAKVVRDSIDDRIVVRAKYTPKPCP